MRTVLRLLLSAVSGFGITLACVVLAVVGGIGPCGAATTYGDIAGWMSYLPGLFLCEMLLGSYSDIGNSPLVLVIALAPAVLFWSLLTFAALTYCKKREKSRGPTTPPRPRTRVLRVS